VAGLALVGCGGGSGSATIRTTVTRTTSSGSLTTVTTTTTTAPRPKPPAGPPFRTHQEVPTLVDPSRTVTYQGQAPQPRKLVTIVRYPVGPGTFPLIVFGHGFAVTPTIYAPLLDAWARAGYVVAAPIFPLGNANAPGGPDENDLVNQPRDMSFVITRLLALSGAGHGPLDGLIDPNRIAVSGQSDGGNTALTAAYDSQFRDRRIRAAAILSGMEIPGVGGYDFPAPNPPLLATQGLADTINPPSYTYAFFNLAPAPKYLLTLPGAAHLGPYTGEEPQLRIVERVTIDFFDAYLKKIPGALNRMRTAGNVAGVADLQADP
jgi:predicted dienelactone hydrolase